MTARADWLRVLQGEAKVEQCDLFMTVRKSNELNNSGEYAEVIQLEPVYQVPEMLTFTSSRRAVHYNETDFSTTARKTALLFSGLVFSSTATWGTSSFLLPLTFFAPPSFPPYFLPFLPLPFLFFSIPFRPYLYHSFLSFPLP